MTREDSETSQDALESPQKKSFRERARPLPDPKTRFRFRTKGSLNFRRQFIYQLDLRERARNDEESLERPESSKTDPELPGNSPQNLGSLFETPIPLKNPWRSHCWDA